MSLKKKTFPLYECQILTREYEIDCVTPCSVVFFYKPAEPNNCPVSIKQRKNSKTRDKT